MKKILLSVVAMATFAAANAQSLKTIQDIQTVSQQNLANNNDTANFVKSSEVIKVRGVVIVGGGESTLVGGKQVWIQTSAGTPTFSGIDVFQNLPSGTGDGGTGILSLLAGDSVEITGTVIEFSGETELVPQGGTPIVNLGSKTVKSTKVLIKDLNDADRKNILTTGEQYEGMYVEINGATVSSVDYFSNNTRVSFNIVDAQGNKMNVSDRFKSQKIAANGGSFVPPSVGDEIVSIKGIIIHSKDNRGYELHPFKTSEVIYGAAAPNISNIIRNKITPKSTEAVLVSADVKDADGIASANLRYAVGASNTTYQTVAMTKGTGDNYSATIPAQSEGAFVKYFIEATDMSNPIRTGSNPNLTQNANPKAYTVRDAGTSIYDLQYTPFSSANSVYQDLDVTVKGVVTASVNDLGYVYIQQPGQSTYAGISVIGTGLSTLTTGANVSVTGTVRENNGFTVLSASAVNTLGTTDVITATVLPIDSFGKKGFNDYSRSFMELYEGMLVKFAPTEKLKVVDINADAPSKFAEFRLGRDITAPNTGVRVLTNRNTSTTFSSKNVSYFTDGADTSMTNAAAKPVIFAGNIGTINAVTGIVYFGFSNMKLLPRNNADFEMVALDVKSKIAGINVNIYPNPATTVLNVKIDGDSQATANVFNALGALVLSQNISNNATLNIENLTNGQYFISLSNTKGALATGSFMVVR